MGIFGKIKNILFEPDEEELVEDMHVYTKEEVKEIPRKEEVVREEEKVVEPPIRTTNNTHFSNVKRDIDIDYEDKKVLDEVPGVMEAVSKVAEEQSRVVPKKEEVRPSPFQSFDEKEFERVNSRVAKNEHEHKIKKENREVESSRPVNNFRKANNLFSSTSTSTNNDSRLDSGISESLSHAKKPFTPSPVISPVYGILDKNYRKDDIVDKKDGMKREKTVKPIVKVEKVEENVDIDAVRKKAYGTLDDIEKEMNQYEVDSSNSLDEVFPTVMSNDITIEEAESHIIEVEESDMEQSVEVIDDYDEIDDDVTLGDLINSQSELEQNKENNLLVEDELEDEFVEEKTESYEIKEVSEEDMSSTMVEERSDAPRPRLLDDMEKTSTLQILDDIEKELNSIKPISKGYSEEEMKEKIEKSETLENDLFNLIDSMYEQGEEEEDA